MKVRVTGQQIVFMLFAQLLQFVEQKQYLLRSLLEGMFEVKLYVYQHLVVSRATGVQTFAGIANFLCQCFFYLRMNILGMLFEYKCSGINGGKNFFQPFFDRGKFIGRKKVYVQQHFGMSQ